MWKFEIEINVNGFILNPHRQIWIYWTCFEFCFHICRKNRKRKKLQKPTWYFSFFSMQKRGNCCKQDFVTKQRKLQKELDFATNTIDCTNNFSTLLIPPVCCFVTFYKIMFSFYPQHKLPKKNEKSSIWWGYLDDLSAWGMKNQIKGPKGCPTISLDIDF